MLHFLILLFKIHIYMIGSTNDTCHHDPTNITKFLELKYSNRKSEYVRCVAYVSGQIWYRELESFMIALYLNKLDNHLI